MQHVHDVIRVAEQVEPTDAEGSATDVTVGAGGVEKERESGSRVALARTTPRSG